MSDKVIVSKSEINSLISFGGFGYGITPPSIDIPKLRALLDQAQEVSGGAVAYVKHERNALNTLDENGNVCMVPHAYLINRSLPDGTKLYTTQQPDRVAELEATNKKLLDAFQYADRLGLFSDSFVKEQIFSKRQALNKLKQAIAEVEAID